MILQGWQAVPNERLRLARQLGFGPWAMFRMIEWPVLRRVVPPAFAVIFVICLNSFAVVLTLGGGPRATTLELAIYQAFRFDFDLGKAATLATVQVVLAGGAAVLCVVIGMPTSFGKGMDRTQDFGVSELGRRVLDGGVILLALLFLAAPIVMVILEGASHLANLPASVWTAAGRSVLVTLVSTVLCLCLALPLCSKWGEVVGTLGIALSPLVLGTGLFLILRSVTNPFDWALGVTVFLNALLSLPFVLRILRPAAETVRGDYARLGAALGLGSWAWLRWVLIPRIAPAMGYAGGLAAALSMGDLGVIVLFADADRGTLPLKLYQLMGAYRMGDAAAAALVLVGLSLAAFWMFERLGQIYARD
jgi:thiamine transport system permease protein